MRKFEAPKLIISKFNRTGILTISAETPSSEPKDALAKAWDAANSSYESTNTFEIFAK